MKISDILGIFRLSCAFYYKNAHVKTSWEDTSPSRPKFNPLHQRNSPLRLVQRCGTDPGIVTRLKTWKYSHFLGDFMIKHGYLYDKFSSRRYQLYSETFYLAHFLSPDRETKF